jgi:hypothetical protein
MADLYYGDYRSKLVHFEAQKIFSILKSPSLGQFLPWRKYHQKADLHYSNYCS